jgi:hypothetical protein
VEPPVAAIDAMPFSIASRVTIDDGVVPWRSKRITSSPVAYAASSFAGSSAGIPFRPAGEMPRNSRTVAIVLAVY